MSPTDHTRHDTATYTRARDGEWAVRVPVEVQPLEIGETTRLDVHRRSGRVHSETVRCFWLGRSHRSGQRVALCEILPDCEGAPGDFADDGAKRPAADPPPSA